MRAAFASPLAVLLAAGAAATVVAQRGPAAPPLVRENATQKLSEHVYVIPDNNVGMVPNVGIVVGSRATLVIDTGLGARNGQTVMREVEKVSRNGELYLVTTHVHPDHELGAQGFPPHTKMIRSQDQVKEIAEQGLETARRFSGFSPLNAELLKGAEFRKADITFEREHSLDLGGVQVRILAMGYNHTRGDTATFVEPDRILFSGDVSMSALPNAGGSSSVATWIESQDRFAALRPERVVPSHGPVGDAAMIARNKEFLTAVRARTAALKKAGTGADEAVKTIQSELEPKFGASPRMATTIRTAYNEAP